MDIFLDGKLNGISNVAKFKQKSISSNKKTEFLALFCGLVIGLINGLFGAGGGMLVVPVLSFLYGLGAKKAHATAIMLILPLCIASAIVYGVNGGYDYSIFPYTVSGVVVGGIVGAYALKKANNVALRFVFYALMLFAGIKMII